MNDKINSNKIKTALLHNFIFIKQYIGGTEIAVPFGIADCIFIKKRNPIDIIECEIKISKSDILSEFKKKHNKHLVMNQQSQGGIYSTSPNKYYFCVPEELVEYTKQILIDENKPKYGIIQFKEFWHPIKSKNVERLELAESIQIIKPARNLRSYFPIDKTIIEEYKHRIELRNIYLVNTLMRMVYFNLDKASMNIYRPITKKDK